MLIKEEELGYVCTPLSLDSDLLIEMLEFSRLDSFPLRMTVFGTFRREEIFAFDWFVIGLWSYLLFVTDKILVSTEIGAPLDFLCFSW